MNESTWVPCILTGSMKSVDCPSIIWLLGWFITVGAPTRHEFKELSYFSDGNVEDLELGIPYKQPDISHTSIPFSSDPVPWLRVLVYNAYHCLSSVMLSVRTIIIVLWYTSIISLGCRHQLVCAVQCSIIASASVGLNQNHMVRVSAFVLTR